MSNSNGSSQGLQKGKDKFIIKCKRKSITTNYKVYGDVKQEPRVIVMKFRIIKNMLDVTP